MEYKKYWEDLQSANKAVSRAFRILRIAERRMYSKAKPDPAKLRLATAGDLKHNALLWYRNEYDGNHTPMIVEEFHSGGEFQSNGCWYYLGSDIFISTE